jgi:hypothetical protein
VAKRLGEYLASSRKVLAKSGVTRSSHSRAGSIFIRRRARRLDGDAKARKAPSHSGLVSHGSRWLGRVIRDDVFAEPDADVAVVRWRSVSKRCHLPLTSRAMSRMMKPYSTAAMSVRTHVPVLALPTPCRDEGGDLRRRSEGSATPPVRPRPIASLTLGTQQRTFVASLAHP